MYIKKHLFHGVNNEASDTFRCFFLDKSIIPFVYYSYYIVIIRLKGGIIVETIVALHRNHLGEIISFVTSEGRIISYRKALMETENGIIQGVQTIEDANGQLSLIPEPDQSFEQYPDLF